MPTESKILTLLVAAALVAGCASKGTRKNLSTVDSVQSAKERVETTGEYIARAEDALKDFETRLNDLRKEAHRSNKLRGKDKFVTALSQFDERLKVARHELDSLKVANSASWEEYRRKIKAADTALQSPLLDTPAELAE